MNENKQFDFYLKHYAQIEEWALLKTGIRNQLKATIADAFEEEARNTGAPIRNVHRPRNRGLWQLGINNEAYIELTWRHDDDLFSPQRPFPVLAICGNRSEQISDAIREFAELEGYDHVGERWWIWIREVTPDQLPFNIDEYGRRCVRELMDLWSNVGDSLLRISGAQDPVE